MIVGIVTVDGRQVGVVTQSDGGFADDFTPDLGDYEPMGRADSPPRSIVAQPADGGQPAHRHYPGHHHAPAHRRGTVGQANPSAAPSTDEAPAPVLSGAPVHGGSAGTDRAMVEAGQTHNIDPNFMRAIASIESNTDPGSNRNNSHQYKGLYQIGRNEWAQFGQGGDIYNARDNAFAAARYFDANRRVFRQHFGRDPTDAEMYMMHQQGLGFYTRGALTNPGGNLPAGARTPENLTHEGFERFWAHRVAREKAKFEALDPAMHAM